MRCSDKELLRRITQKEYSAFNVFYERYNRLFLQWTYLRTRDSEMTKDICQLFWENLWNSPDSFKIASDGCAKNSLLKILSFRIIDYLRSPEGRLQGTTEENWREIEKNLSCNTILDNLEVDELQTIISEILYEMPLLVQQIFKMRWSKYLTTKEVATELSLSEKTVNKKYREARQLLKEKLFLIYNKENKNLFVKAKLLPIIILLQISLHLSKA